MLSPLRSLAHLERSLASLTLAVLLTLQGLIGAVVSTYGLGPSWAFTDICAVRSAAPSERTDGRPVVPATAPDCCLAGCVSTASLLPPDLPSVQAPARQLAPLTPDRAVEDQIALDAPVRTAQGPRAPPSLSPIV
jgi:hypothetical protein